MKSTFYQALENYQATQLDAVPVDITLRNRLERHWQGLPATTRPAATKPHPVRWLATLSLGLSLAVIIAILSFKQVPGYPTAALAAALNNTFNLESFARTFGVEPTNTLRQRQVTVELVPPSTGPGGVIKETNSITIWNYQDDILAVSKQLNDTPTDAYTIHSSALIKPTEQILCVERKFYEGTLADPANQPGDCTSFTQLAATQLQQLNTVLQHTDTETLIDHMSIDQTVPPTNDTVTVTWSSAEALSDIGLFQFDQLASHGGTDYSVTRVQKTDGLYWYSITVEKDKLNFPNKTFVQVLVNAPVVPAVPPTAPVERSSRIYQIDFAEQTITPVTYSAVEQAMTDASIYDTYVNAAYRLALEPAFYIMAHPEAFTTPTAVGADIINGKAVTAIQYNLPTNWTLASDCGTDCGYAAATQIIIWIDETNQTFVGYTLFDDTGKEVNRTIITDEVLTNVDPVEFFTQQHWRELL